MKVTRHEVQVTAAVRRRCSILGMGGQASAGSALGGICSDVKAHLWVQLRRGVEPEAGLSAEPLLPNQASLPRRDGAKATTSIVSHPTTLCRRTKGEARTFIAGNIERRSPHKYRP
jgi:hypothetical protein